MHGEKTHVALGGAFHRARNGIADIVQFQIEKHFFPGAREHLGKNQPVFRERQFKADLVERDRAIELDHEFFGGRHVREIKGDDQALARGNVQGSLKVRIRKTQ